MHEPEPTNTAGDEAAQIYRIMVRMMAYLHAGFNPARAWPELEQEISFPQFKTMMMLRHVGHCPLKRLAAELGIAAASASQMVERLVELDLVDRRPDEQDRRRVRLSLTHRALKGLERHEALILERLERLRGQLEPAQASHWGEVFAQLGLVLDRQFAFGAAAPAAAAQPPRRR